MLCGVCSHGARDGAVCAQKVFALHGSDSAVSASVLQLFSKEYINLLLTGYFFLLGVLALAHILR